MAIQWQQYCYYAFLFIMLSGFIISTGGTAGDMSWWSIGVTGCGRVIRDPTDECPNCASFAQMSVFTPSQQSQCTARPAVIDGLAKGARAAIIDCQDRFTRNRWNCSTLYGQNLFGAFVLNHTRETAALTSYFIAGGIWGIAEDCHRQKIPDCSCDVKDGLVQSKDEEDNTIFHGCIANYTYGEAFIRSFVESEIDFETFGGAVDNHNIDLAKELIRGPVESCRCHGISGTCAVQTCYPRTHTVAEIGGTIREKYDSAQKVDYNNGELFDLTGQPVDDSMEDMVFSTETPNLCRPSSEKGVLGVGHRKCDPNLGAIDSCNNLCCDMGSYTETKIVPVEECKFHYCCEIRCRIIRNDTVVEHFCNAPPESQS